MEAQEDFGKEGSLGGDPLARPNPGEAESSPESSGEQGDTPDEQFVEEMESDPARAGTDSPTQDLQGG